MEDCDCLGNVDSKTKCLCISITSAVLLFTVGLVASFGAVEPTEYGILYNVVSKSIDKDNIYEGGLKYIGLTNKMITFPRTHTSIEFSSEPKA